MPDNSPRGARLDHVSEAGDLVFEAGGERFVVTVDEALERAVLEAKQLRLESLKLRQPKTSGTLPISKIQQLIRAGEDPAKVAERYGLAEALVRRFSSSVQLEKQYAIEQFKRVPAPKESRAHTVEELIDQTLRAARIDRATLSWSATRQGHDPWRVAAQFLSAGRRVRAEWTWNMHDNTVVCLNAAARKLLGEQNLNLPGSDRRSSLTATEEAMAPVATGLTGPIPLRAEHPSAHASDAPLPDRAGDVPSDVPSPAAETSRPASPVPVDAAAASVVDDIPVYRPDSGITDEDVRSDVVGDASPDGADGASVEGGSDGADRASEAASIGRPDSPVPARAEREQPKRRSGRSAVPSWDEILFGE